MPLTVIDGPTIQAGQSLSDAVDCSAGVMVRLTMPAGWTSAGLTFQLSSDGIYFNDFFDPLGREIVLTVVPGTGVRLSRDWGTAGFMKFRSGTRDHPVEQEETRQFAVAIDTGVLS